MARRASKKASATAIPMAKPDRSGPDPSYETLLDIAAKRGLLKTADDSTTEAKEEAAKGAEEPGSRLGESILWSISLAMLHFTFDVLVQHQYAESISWPTLVLRGVQAFGGKCLDALVFCNAKLNCSLRGAVLYSSSACISITIRSAASACSASITILGE
jgi:hypothetical protein